MPSYATLAALANLRRRAFGLDHSLVNAAARCEQMREELHPEEVISEEAYRLEGNANPDDNRVLYALQSAPRPAHKGVLVAAHGPDVAAEATDFIQHLHNQSA